MNIKRLSIFTIFLLFLFYATVISCSSNRKSKENKVLDSANLYEIGNSYSTNTDSILEPFLELRWPRLNPKYDSLYEFQRELIADWDIENLKLLPFTKQLASVEELLPKTICSRIEEIAQNYYANDVIQIKRIFPLFQNDSLNWLCSISKAALKSDFIIIQNDEKVTQIFPNLNYLWDVFLFENIITGKQYISIGGPDVPTGKFAYIDVFIIENGSFTLIEDDQIIRKIRQEFCVYGSIDYELYYYDSLINTDWVFKSLP